MCRYSPPDPRRPKRADSIGLTGPTLQSRSRDVGTDLMPRRPTITSVAESRLCLGLNRTCTDGHGDP